MKISQCLNLAVQLTSTTVFVIHAAAADTPSGTFEAAGAIQLHFPADLDCGTWKL